MTSEGLAAARSEEPRPRPASKTCAMTCEFCRRRLGDEYFFTCRRCKASYCYIHMSRHRPALCERRGLVLSAPSQGERGGASPLLRAGQLILAGSGGGSSANV